MQNSVCLFLNREITLGCFVLAEIAAKVSLAPKIQGDKITRLDAARVTLLLYINKLNKLILAKSKKFTLAVSFFSVPSADITHSHQWKGLDNRHAPSLLVRMTDSG